MGLPYATLKLTNLFTNQQVQVNALVDTARPSRVLLRRLLCNWGLISQRFANALSPRRWFWETSLCSALFLWR